VAHSRLPAVAALAALALVFQPLAASAQNAQSGPGWFVPNQAPQRPAAPAQHRAPAPAAAPAEPVAIPEEPQAPQQIQVQLPPLPEVPEIPKGPPPPAAIIGILSVPDVLRISTAYQQADKALGERRQKLNEDAQKEQGALRDLGQQLANERTKLSPEQIRQKERELQDRIAESRRKFGERNRIIQEAGQYVMAQIDRAMEVVAQKVAASRGVNVVLNRAQILGTTADFDLTPQVADVLNKMLPSVDIPPDGVSPVTLHPVKPAAKEEEKKPAASAEPAKPAATPAKAPAKR
jgi:Skp family chaperone for outer membrane proteins